MVYLDNAATTWPKPPTVIGTMVDSLIEYGANPGRSGHKMSLRAMEKIYECRELVSDFFGLDNPGNVIFTQNATHALNIVIRGILKRGDHAVCTAMDHNSVLRPIFDGMENVKVSVAKPDSTGSLTSSDIESLIKPNTKLVVMTHVSNVCGTIMPINETAKLCRKNGIRFMIDASQSAGILDIDIKSIGADYLAASGHKGLYGPMGTGILCINSSLIPDPILFGGTGSNSKELFQPRELPDRFECGTLNLPGICGLAEGIRFVQGNGTGKIYSAEMKLTSTLLSELSHIPGIEIIGNKDTSGRTGVVSFVCDRYSPSAIAAYLDRECGVAIRSMYHCAGLAHKYLKTENGGTARISLGAFNSWQDIDVLIGGIKKLCS